MGIKALTTLRILSREEHGPSEDSELAKDAMRIAHRSDLSHSSQNALITLNGEFGRINTARQRFEALCAANSASDVTVSVTMRALIRNALDGGALSVYDALAALRSDSAHLHAIRATSKVRVRTFRRRCSKWRRTLATSKVRRAFSMR